MNLLAYIIIFIAALIGNLIGNLLFKWFLHRATVKKVPEKIEYVPFKEEKQKVYNELIQFGITWHDERLDRDNTHVYMDGFRYEIYRIDDGMVKVTFKTGGRIDLNEMDYLYTGFEARMLLKNYKP